MPEGNGNGTDNQKLSNEFVWTLQRSRVLFRYWTMPLLVDAKTPSGAQQDGVSARAFALLLIVALTFAVRGEPTGDKTASFTALAAALGAALSFGLNFLAKNTGLKVREPALIGAYASTILVMLGYLLIISFFTGVNWFEIFVDYVGGHVIAAVILSVGSVYILLVIKALFWDKNKISLASAAVGLGITIGSGIIVYVISYVSNDVFKKLIEIVCGFGACHA